MKLISCELKMNTVCVELLYSNNIMIAINTIAIENEIADNMSQQSGLTISATMLLSDTLTSF